MRAVEFKSKIINNQILIPSRIQSELKTNEDIKVIVLIDDADVYDDMIFQQSTSEQFLKGYSEIDSIYDND